jgi:hypothetical protein
MVIKRTTLLSVGALLVAGAALYRFWRLGEKPRLLKDTSGNVGRRQ